MGRGGSLLKQATAKWHQQQGTKSECLEVHYSGGCAWLECAQMMKLGGIQAVTA